MGDNFFFSNRKPSCHLDHNYWKGRGGRERRKREGKMGEGREEEGEKGREEEESREGNWKERGGEGVLVEECL